MNGYQKMLARGRRLLWLTTLLLLAACSMRTPITTPAVSTSTLPAPQVYTTSTPEMDQTAQAFLEAWKAEDYPTMYSLLSASSQASITQEQFVKRYTDVANESGMIDLGYQLPGSDNKAPTGEIGYQVTLKSAIVGDIVRDMKMPLVLEGGQWKINWSDGLILPELAGGNYLKMDAGQSQRQPIYDRNGNPLASQTEAISLGVYPDYVVPDEDAGLVSMMAQLVGLRYDQVAGWLENAQAGSYIPFGEIPADQAPNIVERLTQWGAAEVHKYSRRFYWGNGAAPHITGYVSAIQEDELKQYRRKGYRADERVGRKGLEQWGEDTLMGKPGGTLFVFSPDGNPLTQIGEAPAEPGQSIYTTVDRDFQAGAQEAMKGFNGAAVVLEMNTGRVLAMVSSPGFDPNAYEIENFNWNSQLGQIVNDPNLPQFNRATQGQYPLGSVFKIITMSAALESKRFTKDSTLDCQYAFNELPGLTLYDWTWDHFQEDGKTLPSGMLTLPQGLIRSCNPWFWYIGLDLYRNGFATAIANMARGFGLGSKTGIVGVDEEAGKIPDATNEVDATNQAIGQGDTQVTPLQVARFVAAMGNGGTLYRPQLIEKIVGPSGTPSFEFKPEAQGTLPISPETRELIVEAMKGVVASKNPVGTAYQPMAGLDIPTAGKTGTAQAAAGDSHAWYAGFTFAGREDKPDIAIAVLAENAGEGSQIAAPIFRRLVELYFYGKPLKLYRWESGFGITRTPTEYQEPTETPEPGKPGGGKKPTKPPLINP